MTEEDKKFFQQYIEHASLVIKYGDETLYLDAAWMARHSTQY